MRNIRSILAEGNVRVREVCEDRGNCIGGISISERRGGGMALPGLSSIEDFHRRLNRNVHIEFFEAQASEI